jgi:anti-anti-sigma factor
MSEEAFKHMICPLVVVKVTEAQIRGDNLSDALRDELLAVATQTQAVYVVLDFQTVTFLGSTGIRPLLSLNRYLHTRGGRLILCNLNDNIREVFEQTRLISTGGSTHVVFEVQPDVPTAIAAVYKGGV